MKKESLFPRFHPVIALFIIILYSGFTNTSSNQDTKSTEESQSSISSVGNNQLNHLLLFNFKESATPENIANAEDGLVSLGEKIPQIKNLEWGFSKTPGAKSKGFSHWHCHRRLVQRSICLSMQEK